MNTATITPSASEHKVKTDMTDLNAVDSMYVLQPPQTEPYPSTNGQGTHSLDPLYMTPFSKEPVSPHPDLDYMTPNVGEHKKLLVAMRKACGWDAWSVTFRSATNFYFC